MLLNARGNEDDEDESLVLLLKPSTTFAFEFLSILKTLKKSESFVIKLSLQWSRIGHFKLRF